MKRPSSKPRVEIEQLAAAAIERHGGPLVARVYFKYDCAGCDCRVMVVEPNLLPQRARCDKCATWTTITAGGFLLQLRRHAGVPWLAQGAYWRKDYTQMPGTAYTSEIER